MDRFIVATECIIEHEGKFLLITRPIGKHGEGTLAFPGGTFETSDAAPGADALKEAVKREVKEEVGIELLDPINYVTASYFVNAKCGSPVVDIIYHCRLERTSPKVTPKLDEVPMHRWMAYQEAVADRSCPEWTARYLGLVRKNV